MKGSIRVRVVRLMSDYVKEHGRRANMVDLTLRDEMELYSLGANELGSLSAEFAVNGRRAMSHFYGLLINWGAERTRVYEEGG